MIKMVYLICIFILLSGDLFSQDRTEIALLKKEVQQLAEQQKEMIKKIDEYTKDNEIEHRRINEVLYGSKETLGIVQNVVNNKEVVLELKNLTDEIKMNSVFRRDVIWFMRVIGMTVIAQLLAGFVYLVKRVISMNGKGNEKNK